MKFFAVLTLGLVAAGQGADAKKFFGAFRASNDFNTNLTDYVHYDTVSNDFASPPERAQHADSELTKAYNHMPWPVRRLFKRKGGEAKSFETVS